MPNEKYFISLARNYIFTILHRYAQYSEFKLGSEKEKYRLEIGGYEGNAGDSLNDPWYGSNLRPFSTFDK